MSRHFYFSNSSIITFSGKKRKRKKTLAGKVRASKERDKIIWQSVTPNSRDKRRNKKLVANSTPRSLERQQERDKRRRQCFPNTPERARAQSARHIASLSPNSSNKRLQKRRHSAARRIIQSNSSIENAGNKFLQDIKIGPEYICTICHRMLYRQTVVLFHKEKLTKLTPDFVENVVDPYLKESAEGKTWICTTCKGCLSKGRMPAQAKANSLQLDQIPEELQDLNDLEAHLISKRIAFKKIVALPRGRQKKIVGPVINVVAKTDTLCNLLPRFGNDSQFLPMKLKRKLVYDGHYMFQNVNPDKLVQALTWLKANNKHYKEVTINNVWSDDWQKHFPNDEMDKENENEQSNSIHSENVVHTIEERNSRINYENVVRITEETNSSQYMEQIASQSGLNVIDVASNGDCQFAAVQKLLSVTNIAEIEIQDIRHQVSNYLQQNAHLKHFIPGTEAHNDNLEGGYDIAIPQEIDREIDEIEDPEERQNIRWEIYTQRIGENQWGDHLTLQAIADLFSVKIEVICTANPTQPVHINPMHGSETLTLKLGLIGQTHYVALLPTLSQNSDLFHSQIQEHVQIEDVHPTSSQDADFPEVLDQQCVQTEDVQLTSLQDADLPERQDQEWVQTKDVQQTSLQDADSPERQGQEDAQHTDLFEKQDQEEFEKSSKLKGLPYATCLQEDMGTTQKVFSIAPGEGQTPKGILEDDDFESLAFPHLFPLAENTLSIARTVKLTAKKYFIQRILDCDGRFSKNIDYMLAAQYSTEQKSVQDSITVMMRQSCGKVSARVVKQTASMASLVRNDHAFRVLNKIRGSPPYWSQLQHDVMALIRQQGKATFFVTLSCADLKWPDVIQIIARQYGYNYTEDDIKNMSFEDKSNWLRRNPVTAARHFHYRVQSFFQNFIITPSQPIGEVVDHVIRIEFQARGSPHAHIMLWIKDAPEIGVQSDETVTAFIDRYQTAALCEEDEEDGEINNLVNTVQRHNHSSYCRKNGTCRFQFPKAPSDKTIIARCTDNDQELVNSNAVLKKVNEFIHQYSEDITKVSLQQILLLCNISEEDYVKALSVTKRGSKIILKRSTEDLSTNSFNKDILKFWKANIDVQYIIDSYACVMYIASYVLKAEKGMSEMLKSVAKEAESLPIRQQLQKLGSTFLNHREISSQEAVYRLLSLPLKKMSRSVVFVNTNPKEKRLGMLKPMSVIEAMDNDSEDIFMNSLIDKYINRPDDLEGMCLAEFASKYSNSTGEHDVEDHLPDNPDPSRGPQRLPKIKLKNNMGCLSQRKKEAIIRFYHPRKSTEEDMKYRSIIMLYHP